MTTGAAARPWQDASRPLAERVDRLLAEMTLEEKLAQLGSVWIGADLGSGNVAPMQEAFADPVPFEQASEHGMGHFTRPLGTAPIEPVDGARRIAELQRDLVARTRLGVPAIAHEECLTGFTTWRATVYPTSLAWAATFDPAAIERMARTIGEGMRAVGVHQGLSPVLDVVRDYRWGRVEETMGEDPYLVGVLGSAYVRGLQSAGVDATLKHFAGGPLAERVRAGAVPEALVDRAARRALLQKGALGLLDDGWSAESPALEAGKLDLDPPEARALAREIAEASVVLLANDGTLPLAAGAPAVALVGPCADDPLAFLGCCSYPNHGVMAHHPELGLGIEVPSLRAALEAELPAARIVHEPGCPIMEPNRSGLAAAAEAARAADVCVAVVGDRPGLFGRGTSGEGCDAEDLSLPGVQDELVEALLATGTPLVLVVVSGRPYALGRYAGRLAAAVQAFIPGEEGGAALAGVLSGRVVPSGKLPVQIPRSAGGQPSTYLHPVLGGNSGEVSNLDPTPAFPFGHGLSYTAFEYGELALSAGEIPTDGEVEVACVVRNAGERAGIEVVQLYLADPVAQVTRPVIQLAGFARVALEPGAAARVAFRLHADRTAFTGVDLRRIVEPGEIHVLVGSSSADIRARGGFRLAGEEREAGRDRVLDTPCAVDEQGAA